MNTGKEEERKELASLVGEYISKGGKIQQIPIGMTGGTHRTINNKKQLYGLSRKRRPGFDKERLTLRET